MSDPDISLNDLSGFEGHDEQQLIGLLAQRVAEMLDRDPGLLFSTLYRLDVREKDIHTVFHSAEDPAHGLARLIVERQKEKLKTRSQWKKDWGS